MITESEHTQYPDGLSMPLEPIEEESLSYAEAIQSNANRYPQRLDSLLPNLFASSEAHIHCSSDSVISTSAEQFVPSTPLSSFRNTTSTMSSTAFDNRLIPSPLRPRRDNCTMTDSQIFEIEDNSLYTRFRGDSQTLRPPDDFRVPTHYRPTSPEIEAKFYDVPTDPRPPPRTFRSSLHRWSLTPSEMPYLSGTLLPNYPLDNRKAEAILGLRRHALPPPMAPPETYMPFNHAIPFNDDTHPPERYLFANKHSSGDNIDPLNGRTAWLHALTGMLVVFNCWGISNAFGLFQEYYHTTLLRHSRLSSISWIGSTQLALVFGMGFPIGRLVDKGHFHLVFHSGSVLMVAGLLISSWCHTWWTLWLVQGLLTGTGMGAVFCSGIVAMMTWFDEKAVGLAMGLGAGGSCIGGIVYVLIARHLLIVSGFATTMRVLSAVAAATMIPSNFVFRMRVQKHRNGRQGSGVNTGKALTWRTFAEPSYLLAAGGMFFCFLGVYFGFVYMVSYGSQVLQLSNTSSTNLLIFMLAANLPGRFLPALISDKCIGPLNTIIPSVFLSSAIIWLWAATDHNHASLTVVACFYGFVSAGVQVLYAPTVYTFCLEPIPIRGEAGDRVESEREMQLAIDRIGVKAGGIFTCIGLACLIGTPIGGALISYRTHRWMPAPFLGAQIFAGCSLLVGAMFLLASRVAKAGWAAKWA